MEKSKRIEGLPSEPLLIPVFLAYMAWEYGVAGIIFMELRLELGKELFYECIMDKSCSETLIDIVKASLKVDLEEACRYLHELSRKWLNSLKRDLGVEENA